MKLVVLSASWPLKLLFEFFVAGSLVASNHITPDAVACKPQLLGGGVLSLSVEA